MKHKIKGVCLRVEECAYYVNKLRQKFSLDTWIWRQIVTSQRPHTTNKWPPYATEWKPQWKFSVYATGDECRVCFEIRPSQTFFVCDPLKRFFYATPLNESLGDNDMRKRLIMNLKRHFCPWRNDTNAHHPRK